MSTDHEMIVTPDSRSRFGLGKVIDKTPDLRWKVYVDNDGRSIRLEAVVAK